MSQAERLRTKHKEMYTYLMGCALSRKHGWRQLDQLPEKTVDQLIGWWESSSGPTGIPRDYMGGLIPLAEFVDLVGVIYGRIIKTKYPKQ